MTTIKIMTEAVDGLTHTEKGTRQVACAPTCYNTIKDEVERAGSRALVLNTQRQIQAFQSGVRYDIPGVVLLVSTAPLPC